MTALTEIVICNMALSRIGVSEPLTGDEDGTLAACTDTSVAKSQCELFYERCRRRLMSAVPWPFARKFKTLTRVSDGGTSPNREIWADEWQNAYGYPDDCLIARRFVNDKGLGYYRRAAYYESRLPWSDDNEWKFEVRVHDGDKVILTDVQPSDADLEYTEDLTDASRFTEPFASTLAWQLASELALPLDVNVSKAQAAKQAYYTELSEAAAYVFNEEQPPERGDEAFLNARGF
jgi:hypothetical protein